MKSKRSAKRPESPSRDPVSQSSVVEEPIDRGSPLDLFRQYGTWIGLVLFLLPVLLCLFYVHSYAVNVVWEDQGDGLLPLFEKWDAGTLHMKDLWISHAEHNIFCPRTLMFGLGILSRWNTVVEMYVIQGLLLLTLAVFAYVFYRECRSDYTVWWLLPIPWLVLTLRQSQNLLFGWQICYVMASTTAVGALFFLYLLKTPAWLRSKFAAALAIASVSTFSLAQGLLLWPVGLLPLMLLPYSRVRRFTLAGIWMGVGVVELIIYFWNYHQPRNHPPFGFSVEYFVVAVGGALFPITLLAKAGGVVILILVLFATVISRTDRKWAEDSFWLAAIVFSILVQLEVTVGRSGFGVGQATSSRYATYSIFIVLGLYGILSARLAASRSPFVSAVWGVLLGVIVLGLPLSIVEGIQAGEQMRQGMEYQAYVFATSETQPDEVVQTDAGPEAPAWREGLKLLKKLHWNVYSSPDLSERYSIPPASLPTQATSALVKPGMSIAYKNRAGAQVVVIGGYALAPEGNDRVGGIVLEIDDRPYRAYYGLPIEMVADARIPAVARIQSNSELRDCGFRREFSEQQLSAGPHRLEIKVLTKDGTAWYTPGLPQTFNVPEWPARSK